jgi:hypothetical protein
MTDDLENADAMIGEAQPLGLELFELLRARTQSPAEAMAAIAWALAQTLAQIESKADRVARVETGIEIVADLTVRIYDVYVDPVAESRTNPRTADGGPGKVLEFAAEAAARVAAFYPVGCRFESCWDRQG